jgi:outer membrane receptor protein involved in Fe transport
MSYFSRLFSVAALTLPFAVAQAQDLSAAGPQSTSPTNETKPDSTTPPQENPGSEPQREVITVTASRANLIGKAATASQGTVTKEELTLRPVYRVGQLLESMPGLVVTVHSGEGKANQYLLRGFNLDHGTDLANFVDDMPVNRPTNTHGQGYSDLNFIVPQIIQGVSYTKGPYYAAVGDFGAVGSEHIQLADDIPNQIAASIGTLGSEELYAGGTYHFDADDRLYGAADVSHLDGPFTHPDNYRKIDLASRFSHGTDADGFSVAAMFYKGQGRNTTDQPQRAITEGLITRYGTLDPTDGSDSNRWSLSGHYGITGDNWDLKANAYYIHSTMTLWNNFTHYLNDHINGDQEQQDETRTTLGGAVAYKRYDTFAGIESDTTVGVQDRYDDEYLDRRHTRDRVVLSYCNDGDGNYSIGDYRCSADLVQLNDVAPYIENTTHWLPWLRTIVGVREDYSSATDRSLVDPVNASPDEFLFQPKGSIAIGPWHDTEIYYSAGKGFHSDDVRGVIGSAPLEGTQLSIGRVPLMAKAFGQEIGIRNASIPDLQIQLVTFREDFSSELEYDQDAGQDQATAPSRREGVELSAQYHPFSWLELNTDLAATRARFFKNATTLASFYGIAGGSSISNAPNFIGSFGVLVDNLGPWFGGLQERILGAYPLTDGPGTPRAPGYTETNIDVGYKFSPNLKLQMSIYNLFNTKAYSAEYYYATDINAAEVAKYGNTGVSDYQVHPLEPLSVRFTVTANF